MRILHTADWHLGSQHYGYDRTDELFQQVEQVLGIVRDQEVEVLLIAGDVFEKRRTALPELTKRLSEILAPFIRDGLHVVLIPGNHDDREHFEMMDALLTLEQGQSERVHVFKRKQIMTIKGVQFAAIPYPLSETLQPYRSGEMGATARNVSMSEAYARVIRSVISQLDTNAPSMLIAHINVAGVITPENHELSYDEDIRLGRGDLPIAPNLKYIALGHIHQCQAIDHPIPCYYSGSIDCMDWGERKDQKQVIVVDIGAEGDAQISQIDLKSTPFYSLDVKTSQLDDLTSMYTDLDKAFVRVNIQNDTGVDTASIYRSIKRSCPRQIKIEILNNVGEELNTGPLIHHKSTADTVNGYLRQRYKDDPDLPELENLTNQLMTEVENVDSAS